MSVMASSLPTGALGVVLAPLSALVHGSASDARWLSELAVQEIAPPGAHLAALLVTRMELNLLPYQPRVSSEGVDFQGSLSPELLTPFEPPIPQLASAYLQAAIAGSSPGRSAGGRMDRLCVDTSLALGELPALLGAVSAAWWALLEVSVQHRLDAGEALQRLCLSVAAAE